MKAYQILKYIVEHQKTVTTKRLANLVLDLGKHIVGLNKKVQSQQKTIDKLNARCQRAGAEVKYLKSKKGA